MYGIGKTLKKKNDIIFCTLSSSSITLFSKVQLAQHFLCVPFHWHFFYFRYITDFHVILIFSGFEKLMYGYFLNGKIE